MYPKIEGVSAAVRPFLGETSAVARPRCQTPEHTSITAAVPRRDVPEALAERKFSTSVV